MPRRLFAPHSRQFNERMIRRKQTRWDQGMFRQEDTEGIDVPTAGLSDAVNFYGFKGYGEGRPGCRLWTPADFGVTITDNTESLGAATQIGELYAANSDTIPSVGDLFMVYSDGDFTSDELETAKGDAVRKYDIFKFTNVTDASEAVRFMGNLQLPAVPDYGDTSSTEFTASKSGTTITATAGPSFTSDHVGTYYKWYTNGTRDLIIQFLTTTTVQVDRSGTIASETKGQLQGFQNATLHHKGINKLIKLLGDRIFVSKEMPLTGWDEVPLLGTIRPNNGRSYLYQEGDDALLINSRGQFRIVFTDGNPYYYKMNTDVPTVNVTAVAYTSAMDYKYRITYTLARIVGNKTTYDRSDGDAYGTILLQETGPIKKDVDRIDYGEVWTAKEQPIGDGGKTEGKLTGGTLAGNYRTVEGYKATNDAQMGVTINTTTANVEFDFRACENLGDIAAEMQLKIRKRHAEFKDVRVEAETNHFIIWAGEGNTVSACTVGTAGTDMSVNTELDTDGTITQPMTTTAKLVGSFTLPNDSEHITHYSPHRTPDCSKEEDNEHDFVWVGDIPVCKAFTASTATGASNATFTPTEGTLEQEDEGCTLTDESGNELTIVTVDATANTCTVTPNTAYASRSWGIGGGTVMTASQDDTAITIVSGKSLAAADEGKQIFWADGWTTIIKSVTNSTTGVAVKAAVHASQGAHMDPVSRNINLTVSDEDITSKGRRSAWPLENRYHVPLPDSDVGALTEGYMIVGVRGGDSFQYCERNPKWRMGYYNDGHQFNEEIWDGLQSISVTDGGSTVKGVISTRFQTDEAYDAGDKRVGESVMKLLPMQMRSEGTGVAGDGGRQVLDNGNEMIITSEPAVRQYDGNEYGKNYALHRIQKSDLQKLKPVYITGYQRVCGLFVWGKQASVEAMDSTAVSNGGNGD